MLNRCDRKRPSAVLEDRVEIDPTVDLDSSALGYLEVDEGCSVGKGHKNDSNEYLSRKNLQTYSKPIQVVNDSLSIKNTSPCYVNQSILPERNFNKINIEPAINMASSPSKNKNDIGSSSGNGPTNSGHDGEDIIHLKILVPSVAAGAIIGKGGETIADAQMKSGAKVKMSKSNDFYPGTNERVCLITGNVESVSILLDFIMDKIRHKPDPNAKPAIDFDNKVSAEREKQVKAIIPNSTAGMIIGKGGTFIKQLKDESGAFIQLSQKSKDTTLQERVVTVIGEPDCNRKAMAMIIEKIQEDPQSGTCLNISYSDVHGLVANFNPTGSPYANSEHGGEVRPGSSTATNGCKPGYSRGATCGALSPNSSNISPSLPSNDSDNVPSPFVLPLQGGGSLQLRFNMNTNRAPTDPALMSQYLEHIKGTLRSSGYYSDLVVDDIAQAINVLSSHGILVVNLMSPAPAATNNNLNHSHLPHHQQQQQHHQQAHQSMSSSATSSPNGIVYRSGTSQAPLSTTTLMASSDQHSQLPNQLGSTAASSITDAIMSNRQNQQQIHPTFQSSQPLRSTQQTHQQGHPHPPSFATSNNAPLTPAVGGHSHVESHQMNSFGLVHSNNHANHTIAGGGGNMYAAASPRQPTTYWTPASQGTVGGSVLPQNNISENGSNGIGVNDSHSTAAARMIGNNIAAAVAHHQQGGLLPLDSSSTSTINMSSIPPSAAPNTTTGMVQIILSKIS